MTDMRRMPVSLPDSLDKRILELRKDDRFVRCSYSEIARRYLPNGTSYDIGRPDALHIAVRTGEIQTFHKNLPEMADRWSVAVIPQISDMEADEDPVDVWHAAAESVAMHDGDDGVALAHQLGQQAAARAEARVAQ